MQAGISQAGYERLEQAWGKSSSLRATAEAALRKWIFGRTPSNADWKGCLTDIFGVQVLWVLRLAAWQRACMTQHCYDSYHRSIPVPALYSYEPSHRIQDACLCLLCDASM